MTMPKPFAVLRLALRPWHVISDFGVILEVRTEQEAQTLRDDGYIVITDPFQRDVINASHRTSDDDGA